MSGSSWGNPFRGTSRWPSGTYAQQVPEASPQTSRPTDVSGGFPEFEEVDDVSSLRLRV